MKQKPVRSSLTRVPEISRRGGTSDSRLPAGRLLSFCLLLLLALIGIAFSLGWVSRRSQAAVGLFANTLQTPGLDYSRFLHTSQRHASLSCASCHPRSDNSATPRLPGHKACTSCHLTQFVTPSVPMCAICHTDINGSNPPVKNFPARFKESFNMKFDHAQHMTGIARPRNGCASCHDRGLRRGVALSIPAGLSAHNQCYTCHTPNSQTGSGREMASCGVCHGQAPYARTTTNARAFRAGFSHADHGPRQRLSCAECHNLTAGAPRGRQVSAPRTAEHFAVGRATSCMTCHNGRRAFGGDLGFSDCKRCHAGSTFRMPL